MRKTHLFLILILVAFGLYGSTLTGGFLGDDFSLLGFFHQSADQAHTEEAQWHPVQAAFTEKVAENRVPKYYRPLWFLSLFVDHQIFGAWSPGFRLHNLLLFAFSAFFLACLLKTLTGSDFLAVSSALLFLALPTNYASVLWIADRTGQLSVFFSLACLWSFLHSVKTGSWGSLSLAMLCAVGALLSKETSLALFPLLAALCIGLAREGLEGSLRRRMWVSLAPFLLLLTLYFIWRHHILGTFLGGARDVGRYSVVDMVQNQGGVALSLLVPLRWPAMGPGIFWSAAILTAGAIGSGLWLARRSAPWTLLFVLWFVVALLPNALDSTLPGAQRNLRFTFPPAVPFVVLGITALGGWAAWLGSRTRPLRGILMSMVLVTSVALLLHNRSHYVEAGQASKSHLARLIELTRRPSNKAVLIYDLPAWQGNAPLMLNAFPFILHPPFLLHPQRPLLAYSDGDLGHILLLREVPARLGEWSWHALRWDRQRQALVPAALPDAVILQGVLQLDAEGRPVLKPSGSDSQAPMPIRFSRRPLSPFLDKTVELRGLRLESGGRAELVVGDLRAL